MNVLPTMSEQAHTFLASEPSPLVDFKVKDDDQKWQQACYQKFPWIATAMQDSVNDFNPISIAARADSYALR